MGSSSRSLSEKKHVFQCECHDFHFLLFSWYPRKCELFAVSGYLAVGGRFWSSWRQRFKVMWQVFTGREDVCTRDLLLDEHKAVELRDALNDFIKDVHWNQ